MKTKIRVGVIGSGFGARIHVPMFQLHDGFEVVALSTATRRNASEIKGVQGVNVYRNWQEMIDCELLDLLSIASLPSDHLEMTQYAFSKGLHVLCEKPMAINSEQTNEMIQARDKSGKKGFLNFEWRYLTARLKVKEIIDSGKIGRVLYMRYVGNRQNYSYISSSSLGRRGQIESGGGVLGAIGPHMLDALSWWRGEQVVSLCAQLSITVPTYTDFLGNTETRTADQAFQISGTFADHTRFQVEFISGLRSAKEVWRLEVFGTKGTVIMTDDNRIEINLSEDIFQEMELKHGFGLKQDPSDEFSRYYPAFYPLIDGIYRTLIGGVQDSMLPTFEDGHNVQRILDAVRLSAQNGMRVIL